MTRAAAVRAAAAAACLACAFWAAGGEEARAQADASVIRPVAGAPARSGPPPARPEAVPDADAGSAAEDDAAHVDPEHLLSEDAPAVPSITEDGQHGEDGPDPSARAAGSAPPPETAPAPRPVPPRPAISGGGPAIVNASPGDGQGAAPAPAPASPGAPGEAGPRPPAPRASAAALPAIAPPPRPAPPSARPVSADPGRQGSGPTPPLVSLPTPDPRISDKGLCGDWRLTGTVVPEVEGPGQCGIARPVRVTAVLGVPLEPAATLNCRAARTLASWMERGPVRFAPRALGARLASLRIAGSYACRSRNSVKGARLSEHSKGNAIDIRAFRLADGREISPLRGWRKGQAGAFLLQAWRAACGPFGTVLGPDSDEYHRDHLHLDVADHSNGPYCK